MSFIKLNLKDTENNSYAIYFNTNHIIALEKVDNYTAISLSDQDYYEVKETPEEIRRMIKEAENVSV